MAWVCYKEIHKIVMNAEAKGKSLPLNGKNENGEMVIVEGNASCYRLTTVQKNDWLRINEYYPDGTTTETFEK